MNNKPCPFCGHANAHMAESGGIKWRAIQCDSCRAMGPEVRFRLDIDRMEAHAQCEREATEEWNRRAAIGDTE